MNDDNISNKSNAKNNNNDRSQNPSIEKLLFYKNKSTSLTDYCMNTIAFTFLYKCDNLEILDADQQ